MSDQKITVTYNDDLYDAIPDLGNQKSTDPSSPIDDIVTILHKIKIENFTSVNQYDDAMSDALKDFNKKHKDIAIEERAEMPCDGINDIHEIPDETKEAFLKMVRSESYDPADEVQNNLDRLDKAIKTPEDSYIITNNLSKEEQQDFIKLLVGGKYDPADNITETLKKADKLQPQEKKLPSFYVAKNDMETYPTLKETHDTITSLFEFNGETGADAYNAMLTANKRIIAVNGLIGSGKNTIASYLVSECGYVNLSFAEKLKDAVAALFDLDREMLNGDTVESREWRDVPLDFWTAEMGKEITPRYLLQQFGTECMRNGFYDDIWITFVKKTLKENPNTRYVISDCRFKNEADMIRNMGGEVWYVSRGGTPAWVADATDINISEWKGEPALINPFTDGTYDIHSSERGLMGYVFDAYFRNDNEVAGLHEMIFKQLMA